jgi:dTDP-4-dehydrorhamnose reductase
MRQLRRRGVPVMATTRRAERVGTDMALLDLSQPLDNWEPPADISAACIFAAVSRLAACASDPEGSARINVEQTLALVGRLLARGIYVLFLSTNQVFDGSVAHVAPETRTSPVSEYGRQKARTEKALREYISVGAPVAILRLAKVVSPDMPLVHGWLERLSTGKPIRAFYDVTMAPSPTALVSLAIAHLLRDQVPGVFQLTGPRDVSYIDIGAYVAERIGAPRTLVERVSALDAGQPAGSTPRHTTLDSTALCELYGLGVPDIWTVIDRVIRSNKSRGLDDGERI